MEGYDCTSARQHPDAPESVKAVLCTLEGHDPMTGSDLREATGLPRRTLYSALRRLEDEGILHQQISLRDSRQRYFWLDEGVTAAS